MSRKFGLGKGLDSLLPAESEEAPIQTDKISINQLRPNKDQPRKHFDDRKLTELTESIKEHGIIQPILVMKATSGRDYIIVAGERRWRAAKQAGLKEVPVVFMDVDDKKLLEVSLIENIQREDLNPVEEAFAFKKLMEDYDMTQEVISARVGKSRVAITNTIRLLNLDERVLEYLKEGVITEGHGRALLALPAGDLQLKVCQKAIDEGLSVRALESYIKNHDKMKDLRNKEKKKDIFLQDLEEKIAGILGTRVTFKPKTKTKGKIEIEYYSNEDLERILDVFKVED